MKKNSSYENMTKEMAQAEQRKSEQFFLSLAANLVLDEIFFEKNKKILMEQIDEALKKNNYKQFMILSEQFKKFC